MSKNTAYQKLIDTVNEISLTGESKGLGRFYTEDEKLDGRIITANGKKLIHFGSCGYLGLELDPRLKEAAIQAVHKFGTLFASSRLYASTGNYLELEDLLTQMFGAPILLTTNVSLGHHSVMPIVIGGNDLVIYDQQAHISMHELAYKLRHFGSTISILRHNRLNELENKIEENKGQFEKIWYVTDGVYSMFGDLAPSKDIINLLDKHKKLHLYVDDAHGMSWAGPNGAGYTQSQVKHHPKMIMATSIAKGFGACGGVFVFPTLELRDRVRRWGGPLTYSGPQEPATVGSAVASAKIHLTDEIYEFQGKLQQKIAFCNHIMEHYKVPIISNSNSPIFFAGLGLAKMGYNMVGRILNEGFFTNIGIFPAVPETCTGMRFTITNHIEEQDIENLAKAIAHHLPKALAEEDRSMKDIFRAFRKFSNLEERIGSEDIPQMISEKKNKTELKLKTYSSVRGFVREDWDKMLGYRSAYSYDNLILLEEVFSKNEKPEDNWKFHYFEIKDENQQNVLSTFFTTVLSKDDMIAPAKISAIIEKDRQEDPYYLTSKYLMMGSLLTNGDHLFLDREHPEWKKAVSLLLDKLWELQDAENANTLYLRDFENTDEELNTLFTDHGFIKMDISPNNIINLSNFNTFEEFYESLHRKKKWHIRKDIIENKNLFDAEYYMNGNIDLQKFYQLYLDVQKHNLGLNTFPLPYKLFQAIKESSFWEVIKIKYKQKIAGVVFCLLNNDQYCPVIIGMDYHLPKEINVYKQCLFQIIKRAIELKAKTLHFGITAEVTKKNLGAESIPQLGFVQLKDHYNQDFIDNLKFSVEN
jgi:7-keto-8-aminopelargonate synthetase-like enzyme/predicted N-acyltransferase